MKFEEVINKLSQGKCIARLSWNNGSMSNANFIFKQILPFIPYFKIYLFYVFNHLPLPPSQFCLKTLFSKTLPILIGPRAAPRLLN